LLNFDLDKNCYGCGACSEVCPGNAISMKQNNEGFLIPFIAGALCINCGLCEKTCPNLNPVESEYPLSEGQCFAAFVKDEDERMKSASGAVFPALAKAVLNDGGLVCGCVWNETMEAVHILTDNNEDIDKMRGSKYVQSRTEDCYTRIKAALNEEKKVLFSGTPCQVGGLLSFTGRHDNLYTVAVICAGVESPKVWNKYVTYLEQKEHDSLTDAKFRAKGRLGWRTPSISYSFKSGKVAEKPVYSFDEYMSGAHIYVRNSCTNCNYKNNGHVSDLIIGDFWGAPEELIEKSRNKGISAIIVNTQKGGSLFNRCSESFYVKSVSLEDITRRNPLLLKSAKVSEKRVAFFNNIDRISVQKNIRAAIGNRYAKRCVMWLLYNSGLLNRLKELLGK